MKFCECGCGKEVSKKGNRFIHGHNFTQEYRSNLMKKRHKEWKKQDPGGYREHQSKAGKIGGKKSYELHKEEIIDNVKKFHKSHPNSASNTLKKTRQKYPDLFDKLPSKGGKEMHKKQKQENPEKYYKHQRKASKRANEMIRKNKPYIWKGVHFMSREEMEVAKLLLTKPIVGINCHIKVNGKIIDFLPQNNDLQFQGCFVEYHPWDWFGRTKEEYATERNEIIENSQYEGTPLIVITDIKTIN